jgi:isocitrate/isopropylmalate dehydrogenase
MFDLHPGMERYKDKEEVAVSWRVFSKEGCDRIIRAAFEYAKANGLTSVVSCNKANVIRATDGMMKERFLEIAKEYPEIEAREENADATAMWLLKNPQNYQVIVTSNVFGDILSDEASQLIGGMGFSPSGNIGEEAALFEPSHGSVPKYAHQYKINPCGLLITAAMMLYYLQLDEYAEKLEKAIGDTLVEGTALTYDIWRDRGDKDWEAKAVSTLDMAKAIAAKIDPEFDKKADEICAKAKEMCAWEHLA